MIKINTGLGSSRDQSLPTLDVENNRENTNSDFTHENFEEYQIRRKTEIE